MRFAFRLAAHLGRTVGELTRTMTAAEFSMWLAYFRLEPFGDRQADYRAAVAGILPAQAFSGEKIEAEDLFPSLRPTPEQAAAARAAKAKQKGAAFRAWLLSNNPAFAAIPPGQKTPR